MHGKRFFFFFVVLCCGCSATTRSESNPLISVEQLENSVYITPTEEKSDKVLAESMEINLPKKDDYRFSPINLIQNKLYGLMDSLVALNDVELMYVDIQSGAYTSIKKASGSKMFATMDILIANKDFLIFWENNQEGNIGELDIYKYDFDTKETILITHVPIYPSMFRLSAVQIDQTIYFSLPYDIEKTIESVSGLYEYNLVDQKMNFIRENAYLLKKKGQSVYFQTDGQEKKTISSFDVDTKETTKVFQLDNSKEGILDYTLNDEELMFLLAKEELDSQYSFVSYRYNFETKMLTKFIEKQYMEAISISNNLLAWATTAPDDAPVGSKPIYFLYDLDNDINYSYTDGMLKLCDDGILWTKYNVESNTIPKGEVFLNNNTTLMFKYVEEK